MTLGATDTLCPVVRLPAPRLHTPDLDISFALGPMHHQGRRTDLCDRTGASLPCPPAGTLFLRNRCALTLLGHWLFRPLPDWHPHYAQRDALGRQSHRGMAQILCPRVDLD